MTRRSPFLYLMLAAATLSIGGLAVGDGVMAQEPQKMPLVSKEKGAEEKTEDPSHQSELERLVGHWSGQVRVYTEPGNKESAIEGRGIASASLVMGGKFLRTEYKGEMFDQAFQGLGMDGYDSARGKHVSFWADSQDGRMALFTGDCSDDGKTLTMYADSLDPATGAEVKVKGITMIRSHQRYTYEQYVQNGEGEWLLVMQGVFSKQR